MSVCECQRPEGCLCHMVPRRIVVSEAEWDFIQKLLDEPDDEAAVVALKRLRQLPRNIRR